MPAIRRWQRQGQRARSLCSPSSLDWARLELGQRCQLVQLLLLGGLEAGGAVAVLGGEVGGLRGGGGWVGGWGWGQYKLSACDRSVCVGAVGKGTTIPRTINKQQEHAACIIRQRHTSPSSHLCKREARGGRHPCLLGTLGLGCTTGVKRSCALGPAGCSGHPALECRHLLRHGLPRRVCLRGLHQASAARGGWVHARVCSFVGRWVCMGSPSVHRVGSALVPRAQHDPKHKRKL
jgi:hypothetical protein